MELFLTIFGNFCPMGFFPKNLALSHTTTYGPLTSCNVSEKTNSQSQENLQTGRRTEGRTDGRMDGRTDG